jgi:hypothetical protein
MSSLLIIPPPLAPPWSMPAAVVGSPQLASHPFMVLISGCCAAWIWLAGSLTWGFSARTLGELGHLDCLLVVRDHHLGEGHIGRVVFAGGGGRGSRRRAGAVVVGGGRGLATAASEGKRSCQRGSRHRETSHRIFLLVLWMCEVDVWPGSTR